MLQSILRITGLAPALESVEHRIEDRAHSLIQQGKAVAIQTMIAACLAIGAAILAAMALAAALIALFLWLEPQIGSIAAMGVVAGILLVLGIVLAVGAVIAGRQEMPAAAETTKPVATADLAEAPMTAEEKIPAASPEPLGFTESPPTQPVTTEDVEALFALGEQFARLPHTGIESVDNVLRALVPKAEDAARETVVHAANLVRHGDRSTMLATLGMAFAIGWAMARIEPGKAALKP
jgi:ABC-type multidrug transport system fused ATPase/permease subunit